MEKFASLEGREDGVFRKSGFLSVPAQPDTRNLDFMGIRYADNLTCQANHVSTSRQNDAMKDIAKFDSHSPLARQGEWALFGCCDAKYVPYLAIALKSTMSKNPGLDVFLFTPEIT